MTLTLSRTEKYLLVLGLILALVVLGRVYFLDVERSLTDQNAHLNFSKLVFDSMTPGISQLGFWPPLLHILLAPLTLIPGLYNSGLAAAIVLIPIMLMGTIFLYRTVLLLTKSETFGTIASVLFLTNPFVLYYSDTAMMEVLFLSNLFGVAYFLARWLQNQELKYLIWMGIFISLASLSRYEGLILVPIVGSIIIWQLLRNRKSYSQIEAATILFLLLCFISVGFVLGYGLVYAGNPFAFTGGSWLKTTATAFATQNDIVQSVIYILHASFYMLGKPLVWLSLGAFPLLWMISRQRSNVIPVLLVLFSPILFVSLALYSGSYSIAVPELSPFGFFNNERYGLSWIGFAIVAPILLLHAIANYLPSVRPRFSQAFGVVAIVLAAAFSVSQLYNVAFAQNFSIVKQNINAPHTDQGEITRYLLENYDNGKILLTRADNDPILAKANIPLENYIFEGNYRFFDQSISEPWLFAKWVVMYNPSSTDTEDTWSAQNESVSVKWADSQEFQNYYDLVVENNTRRLYKVNEAAVASLVERAGYDKTAVPSLNPQIAWWDPTSIYAKIQNRQIVGQAN